MVGSSRDSPPASPQPTSEFFLFPPNPLFESDPTYPMYLSHPHLYSSFDTPNVPLSPSPRATRVPIQELFPTMAIEGDNPSVGSTPQGISLETSRTLLKPRKSGRQQGGYSPGPDLGWQLLIRLV